MIILKSGKTGKPYVESSKDVTRSLEALMNGVANPNIKLNKVNTLQPLTRIDHNGVETTTNELMFIASGTFSIEGLPQVRERQEFWYIPDQATSTLDSTPYDPTLRFKPVETSTIEKETPAPEPKELTAEEIEHAEFKAWKAGKAK